MAIGYSVGLFLCQLLPAGDVWAQAQDHPQGVCVFAGQVDGRCCCVLSSNAREPFGCRSQKPLPGPRGESYPLGLQLGVANAFPNGNQQESVLYNFIKIKNKLQLQMLPKNLNFGISVNLEVYLHEQRRLGTQRWRPPPWGRDCDCYREQKPPQRSSAEAGRVSVETRCVHIFFVTKKMFLYWNQVDSRWLNVVNRKDTLWYDQCDDSMCTKCDSILMTQERTLFDCFATTPFLLR